MQNSAAVRAILNDLFGPPSQRSFGIRYWDDEVELPAGEEPPRFTLVLEHPGALRCMLLPPSEIRIAEAYIYGDIDVEGDIEAATTLGDAIGDRVRSPRVVLDLASRLFALPSTNGDRSTAHRWGSRLLPGRRHSEKRDAEAVRFHYNAGNDFYRLWLDRRMVYSSAYFPTGTEDLETAQLAKLDHTCRKLRLRPGERLLDIGCGWGALIIHAAQRYGVEAVGITLSDRQAELARKRIAEAGLDGRCRVEIRDYRELPDGETYDKISSIGMVEHVGRDRLAGYFAAAHRALRPGGLFLNHGIVTLSAFRPNGIAARIERRVWRRGVFTQRWVFPDTELVPITDVLASAEGVGFEVRDMESLREHYARTLHFWIRGLEEHHDEAARLVGEPSYRAWRLCLAGAAAGFTRASTSVIQTLLARPERGGRVDIPWSRADLYTTPADGSGTRPAAAPAHDRTQPRVPVAG